MTQYQRANAVEKIRGYVMPRPGETPEKAFQRARADVIEALEESLECVKLIDFETLAEEPVR